ncbi:MAG: DUF3788 domain-containing protein [Planctomycetota bacterium]|jgi:hypothetical protein
MALSAFDDKVAPPRKAELAKMLGRTSAHWDALRTRMGDEFEPLAEDWNFAGRKWGWSLRLKHKKRAIVYMTPCRRYFLAGFALGEKAVRAARESGVPATMLAAIDEAPRYAEGRGVRLEVRNKKDLEGVVKIALAKMGTQGGTR